MWFILLNAGIETCFGWGPCHQTTDARVLVGTPATKPQTHVFWLGPLPPNMLGSDSKNTSRIQMLRQFDSSFVIDWQLVAGVVDAEDTIDTLVDALKDRGYGANIKHPRLDRGTIEELCHWCEPVEDI